MASNHTANYQLNQWEPGDKVLRTDFNADNLKIDGALHALAQDVSEKADSGAVDGLTRTVNAKAEQQDLAAERAERATADTALGGRIDALTPKAGLQLIQTQTLNASTTEITFSLKDIEWREWGAVFLCMHPVLGGGNPYVHLHINGYSSSKGSSNCGCVLALFPMFDEQMSASSVFLGSSDAVCSTGGALRFQGLHSVVYKASSNSTLEAGTTFQIWGLR